jgi:hypothetical protein
MKKQWAVFSFLCIYFSPFAFSQNLSALINVRKEFYVFEDSFIHQLDYLPPSDFKVGGNALAFTDSRGDFKIYQYGAVSTPINGLVQAYGVSDALVYLKTPASGYVWDHGQLHLLTRFAGDYVLCDSMVGFIDAPSRSFYYYYNGEIYLAEEGTTTQPAAAVLAAGSNVIAFKSRQSRFKIIWRSQVYEQETDYPDQVKSGSNITAWLDQYDPGLRVFYKGETKVIEPFNPRAYEVGNDLMAFVSSDGYFRIFYNGDIYEIGSYVPVYFKIRDHLILFADRTGHLFAFWKGKTYPLENFIPSSITMSQNTAWYYDRSNILQIFSKGEKYTMPLENYLSARLDFDVITLALPGNLFKFFSSGKTYQFR